MGRPISSMHIPRNLVSPQTHTHHLYNYYDEPKRHVLRFVLITKESLSSPTTHIVTLTYTPADETVISLNINMM